MTSKEHSWSILRYRIMSENGNLLFRLLFALMMLSELFSPTTEIEESMKTKRRVSVFVKYAPLSTCDVLLNFFSRFSSDSFFLVDTGETIAIVLLKSVHNTFSYRDCLSNQREMGIPLIIIIVATLFFCARIAARVRLPFISDVILVSKSNAMNACVNRTPIRFPTAFRTTPASCSLMLLEPTHSNPHPTAFSTFLGKSHPMPVNAACQIPPIY